MVKQNNQLKELKHIIKIANKYQKGFYILMEYWNSIADEEKPIVDKKLKRLGL